MYSKHFCLIAVALWLAACVRDGNTIRFDPSVFGGSSDAKQAQSGDARETPNDGPSWGRSDTAGSSSEASATSRPREKLPPGETWQGDDNYTHYLNRCKKGGDKECEEFAKALVGIGTFSIDIPEADRKRVLAEPKEVEDKIWAVSAPEKCDARKEEYDCGPFGRFLNIFPDGGRHAVEAEKQSWIGSNKKTCVTPKFSTDCGDVEFYVEHFPKGPHAAEAKALIAKATPKLDKLRIEEEKQAQEKRREKIDKYCPRKGGRFVSEVSFCSGLHGKSWHRCINEWNKCPL